MSVHQQRPRRQAAHRALGGDLDGALDPGRAEHRPRRGRHEQGPSQAAAFGRSLAQHAAGALPDVRVASLKDLEDLGVVDFDAFKGHTTTLEGQTPIDIELDLVGALTIRPRDPLALQLMAESRVNLKASATASLDETKAGVSVGNLRGLADGSEPPKVSLMGAGIGGAVSLTGQPVAGPGGVGVTVTYTAPKTHVEIALDESFRAVGEVGWTLKATIRDDPRPRSAEEPSEATAPRSALDVPAAAVIGLALGGLLVAGATAMAGPVGAAVALPVVALGLAASEPQAPTPEPGDV